MLGNTYSVILLAQQKIKEYYYEVSAVYPPKILNLAKYKEGEKHNEGGKVISKGSSVFVAFLIIIIILLCLIPLGFWRFYRKKTVKKIDFELNLILEEDTLSFDEYARS